MTIRPSRTLRLTAAALAIASTTIVGTATTASATMGCGEYSFSFEGTRLLNDGISDTAGPFTITLPAGTYDIALHSFDDHVAHPGQTDQTQEQWYFQLDNGYQSPTTTDIPDDDTFAADTFSNVTIPTDATTITVHHLREGGINSVAPLCVGFTTTQTRTQPELDTAIEIAGPQAPFQPLPVTNAPTITVEVEAVTEIAAPPAVAPAPVVETPQLALTGPTTTWTMIATGVTLIALGTALTAHQRRSNLAG
jgi:hypothetical protein